MKGFVEFTRECYENCEYISEKVLVNVKHIDVVFPVRMSKETRIALSSGDDAYIDVVESYEEVKKMIEESQE